MDQAEIGALPAAPLTVASAAPAVASASTFSKSNVEMSCRLPSSVTVKSSFFRSRTRLPCLVANDYVDEDEFGSDVHAVLGLLRASWARRHDAVLRKAADWRCAGALSGRSHCHWRLSEQCASRSKPGSIFDDHVHCLKAEPRDYCYAACGTAAVTWPNCSEFTIVLIDE